VKLVIITAESYEDNLPHFHNGGSWILVVGTVTSFYLVGDISKHIVSSDQTMDWTTEESRIDSQQGQDTFL